MQVLGYMPEMGYTFHWEQDWNRNSLTISCSDQSLVSSESKCKCTSFRQNTVTFFSGWYNRQENSQVILRTTEPVQWLTFFYLLSLIVYNFLRPLFATVQPYAIAFNVFCTGFLHSIAHSWKYNKSNSQHPGHRDGSQGSLPFPPERSRPGNRAL